MDNIALRVKTPAHTHKHTHIHTQNATKGDMGLAEFGVKKNMQNVQKNASKRKKKSEAA